MWVWVELLVAAAFGGAIGWALQMMQAKRAYERAAAMPALPTEQGAVADTSQYKELQEQLAKSEADLDALHQKSGIPKSGKENVPIPEGSLAWRNRHLESRVRFLESKLADLDTSVERGRPPEDQNDEATRLRWRNRYLEGRVKYLEEELVRTGGLTPSRVAPLAATTLQPDVSIPAVPRPKNGEGDKPELIEAPRDGKADDLKLISGIGPKLEQKLNSIGIWHYDQIASWSQAQIDWVNAAISFRGRIERERWVSQARALAQGASPSLETAPEGGN